MLTFDFAILTTGGEHLGIPGEAHAQNGVVHHHKVLLRLIFQIFSDLARREIPNFDETVHGAGDQELTIWRESVIGNERNSESDSVKSCNETRVSEMNQKTTDNFFCKGSQRDKK